MKNIIISIILSLFVFALHAQTVPTVSPTNPTVQCGGTATITASGSTGTYLWYGDSTYTNIIGSNSIINVGPLGYDSTVYVAATTYTVIETYNFTNCSVTGRTGPIQSEVNTAYSGTSLDGDVTITTQGIQEWIIPTTGLYSIDVTGASGGGANGGFGANMQGVFYFTQGEIIKILVGQEGTELLSSRYDFSGGGGSFVTDISNNPYIIAGGGGGAEVAGVGSHGSVSTTGSDGSGGYDNGVGGSAGNGGTYVNITADGGAGLTGNGASGNPNPAPQSFVNGGAGGCNIWSTGCGAEGGFGGGGACNRDHSIYHGAGAGGGYSGGGSSYGEITDQPIGGGGGSYNSGDNQNNTAGINSGHGYVTISLLDTNFSILVPVQITVLPIDDPMVNTPISICKMDSVTLTASGSSGNYNWYSDSLGVNLVGTGSSFTTPALNSNTTYYVEAVSGAPQNTYNFTNCGVTGRTGPIQSEVNTAYSGTSLDGNVTITTQGIQEWIVPYTTTYFIEIAGAQGGGGNGGLGANMQGDFFLTAGDTLKILVGQEGTSLTSGRYDYSGGGGCFVTDYSNSPLIISGGGGGAEASGVGSSGQTTTTGSNGTGGNSNGAGGTAGSGGTYGSQTTDGGAGLLGNGGSGNPNPAPQAFINGGEGGSNSWSSGGPSVDGGFGGGGAANRNHVTYHGAGAGGGYSGGGAAYANDGSQPIAGGGGSYNIGTNQSNTAGINTGHGYVTINTTIPYCVSSLIPITIIVDSAPLVTTEPVNSAILVGNNASFSVTATGSGLSYQWQESTDSGTIWINLTNTTPYSNITTATMNITAATSAMDTYYYRCIVNGTCSPSDTSNAGILSLTNAGINDFTLNITNVYPNPVNDILIIKIDNKTADFAKIYIYDLLGKLLMEFPEEKLLKGINTFNLNVESLSAGIYYLKVRMDEGQNLFKLIKN